jgi:D-alanyl-D-alanine carboxypeptidase
MWVLLLIALGLGNLILPAPGVTESLLFVQEGGSAGGEEVSKSSSQEHEPVRTAHWEQPDTERISAKSFVVMDSATGRILWSRNPDTVWPTASIAKLMTAIEFLEAQKELAVPWETTVRMTKEDDGNGTVYVFRDEEILLKDAFTAALVGSVNSLTNAIRRSTGIPREEFVYAMNERARRYGLWKTTFADVTGLSGTNVTTAKEASWLLQEALSYQEIREALQKSRFSFKTAGGREVTVVSTNKLLGGDMRIDGGKTGYIAESLYNFAVRISNEAENHIIVVVLGSIGDEERFEEAAYLSEWAFVNHEWR